MNTLSKLAKYIQQDLERDFNVDYANSHGAFFVLAALLIPVGVAAGVAISYLF